MMRCLTLATAIALLFVPIAGADPIGLSDIAASSTIDYTTIPAGTYTSISLGGTTVTGSSDVVSATYGFTGLGVLGGEVGPSDMSLDQGETMTIDLGTLATNVMLTLVDVEPVGNVSFAFTPFKGAMSLGTFAFPPVVVAPETFNLTSLAGGSALRSFTLSVQQSPPLGLQIQAVSFTPVPEPASLSLLALGLVGLGARRWRQRKA
jgi:PEP-CTERM motif